MLLLRFSITSPGRRFRTAFETRHRGIRERQGFDYRTETSSLVQRTKVD
jgi:hypothetical protein